MSHPEIIIPFGLPPAEHAKDLANLLASDSGTEGLALLLARNRSISRTQFDDVALLLPHEDWLSKKHPISSLQYKLRQHSISLAPGYWFLLNPVHLHIASTHLVLTDYQQLNLSDDESRQLFERATLCCDEIGLQLVYGDAANWFLRADSWSDFVTATPDAACGHNIDIWSPKGQSAREWRKLQNEIQMDWFIHPVQEHRQGRGERVINGLWLWSGTRITGENDLPNPEPIPPSEQLSKLVQLRSAALANDWGTWAHSMIELDRNYFTAIASALKKRQINQFDLLLSNSNTLMHVQITSNSLLQFWRSPNFNHLR